MYFCNFVFIVPWKKGSALHLNTLHPSTICAKKWSLVEICPMVLEENIFQFRQSFFPAILKLSLLEEGQGPSYEWIFIPFTQWCFVPSLVEIGPVVLEKKMNMWKVYDNNDNDKYTQETNFDQKSSLEPSTQVKTSHGVLCFSMLHGYYSFTYSISCFRINLPKRT